MSEYKWLKDQFLLNKGERTAILALMLMLLIFSVIELNIDPINTHENTRMLNQVIVNEKKTISGESKFKKPKARTKTEIKKEPNSNKLANDKKLKLYKKLKKFDPNKPDRSELLNAGISEYVISNWFKYLEKGGRFKSKKDLTKIYGLKNDEYQFLSDKLTFNKLPKSVIKRRATKSVELNSASADQLMSLSGIGPILSERIVKFRSKLGGFHQIEQLREVYGISDSLYYEIKDRFNLIPVYSTININSADFNEIKAHPYIDYKTAQRIMRYRLHHGPYHETEQLYDLKTIDSITVKKILPYLTI